jgi:hypothetical protein
MTKNKISLPLLLVLLIFSQSSFAWRGAYDGAMRTGFHLGVAGTFNSTWILNQNNYNTLKLFDIPIVRQSEMDYIFTWGGNVGAEAGYDFHKRWGVQIEPSYSWAGQKYDDDFVGSVDKYNRESPYYTKTGVYVNVRREIKLQYFQIPVMLKFKTTVGEIANFYAMVGPQVGFRTFASENVWIKNIPYVDSLKFTPDQKFKKVDFGVALNLGIEFFPKDYFYINLGLNSYIGITDLNGNILKTIEWYSKNDVDYQKSRNFRIGLQVGLHFYLTKERYW